MATATLTEDTPSDWGPNYHCPNGLYPCYLGNRIDLWTDLKPEQTDPHVQPPLKSERIEDLVFGLAALPNGDVYVGSGSFGLRHLDAYGSLRFDETSRLCGDSRPCKVGAVARDPVDGTVWVGNRYTGGLHALRPDGSTDHFALNTFGNLANVGIEDVQFGVSGGARKVLVGFRATGGTPGFVAVYSGN
jgi:hypothetical protein